MDTTRDVLAGFKFDGAAREFRKRLPTTVKRIVDVLDLQKDSLLTTPQLAEKLMLSNRTVREHACHPALADYRQRTVFGNVWSNKGYIAKLRKALHETADTKQG